MCPVFIQHTISVRRSAVRRVVTHRRRAAAAPVQTVIVSTIAFIEPVQVRVQSRKN